MDILHKIILFLIARMQLLKLCLNVHIPVSQAFLQVVITEKIGGVARASFLSVIQMHVWIISIVDVRFFFRIVFSNCINVFCAGSFPLFVQAMVGSVLKSFFKLEQDLCVWFIWLCLCY